MRNFSTIKTKRRRRGDDPHKNIALEIYDFINKPSVPLQWLIYHVRSEIRVRGGEGRWLCWSETEPEMDKMVFWKILATLAMNTQKWKKHIKMYVLVHNVEATYTHSLFEIFTGFFCWLHLSAIFRIWDYILHFVLCCDCVRYGEKVIMFVWTCPRRRVVFVGTLDIFLGKYICFI